MVRPSTPLSCTVGPSSRRRAGVSGCDEIRSGCSIRTVRGERTSVTTTGHRHVLPLRMVVAQGYEGAPLTSPPISRSIRWFGVLGRRSTSRSTISPGVIAPVSSTRSTSAPRGCRCHRGQRRAGEPALGEHPRRALVGPSVRGHRRGEPLARREEDLPAGPRPVGAGVDALGQAAGEEERGLVLAGAGEHDVSSRGRTAGDRARSDRRRVAGRRHPTRPARRARPAAHR